MNSMTLTLYDGEWKLAEEGNYPKRTYEPPFYISIHRLHSV